MRVVNAPPVAPGVVFPTASHSMSFSNADIPQQDQNTHLNANPAHLRNLFFQSANQSNSQVDTALFSHLNSPIKAKEINFSKRYI